MENNEQYTIHKINEDPNELDNSQNNYDFSEQYLAKHPEVIEYMDALAVMMYHIVGAMANMGLTNFDHFLQTYIHPDRYDSPHMQEVVRWLRSVTASQKKQELNGDQPPKDIVISAQKYKSAMLGKLLGGRS